MNTNKVVIVCGAGISVSSGIPTYRSEDGLWNIHDMMKICNKGCELNNDSITFYDAFRRRMSSCMPSSVHIKLAQIQKRLGEDRCIIYTQNVDDLLERAGCTKVHHIHGKADQSRCTGCNKREYINQDMETLNGTTCTSCGGRLRYDIVYYGEKAEGYVSMIETVVDMEKNDVFILMGTSCGAISIDAIARPLKMVKVYVNPVIEPTVDITRYRYVLQDKAENVLNSIENIIYQYV